MKTHMHLAESVPGRKSIAHEQTTEWLRLHLAEDEESWAVDLSAEDAAAIMRHTRSSGLSLGTGLTSSNMMDQRVQIFIKDDDFHSWSGIGDFICVLNNICQLYKTFTSYYLDPDCKGLK